MGRDGWNFFGFGPMVSDGVMGTGTCFLEFGPTNRLVVKG